MTTAVLFPSTAWIELERAWLEIDLALTEIRNGLTRTKRGQAEGSSHFSPRTRALKYPSRTTSPRSAGDSDRTFPFSETTLRGIEPKSLATDTSRHEFHPSNPSTEASRPATVTS